MNPGWIENKNLNPIEHSSVLEVPRMHAQKSTHMDNVRTKQIRQQQLAPLKSGAYMFLRSGLIPCEYHLFGKPLNEEGTCECEQIKAYQQKRIAEIQNLPQVKEQDSPLIMSLVREETLQMIIANWLGKKGLVQNKGNEVQPILKLWYLSVNASNRMRDALGLSPQSRAKLGVATAIGFDFAKRMQELEKEEAEHVTE